MAGDNDDSTQSAGVFGAVPIWAIVLIAALSITLTIIALIFCLSRKGKKKPADTGPDGNESPPPPYTQELDNKEPQGANGNVKKTNDVIVTVSKDGTETHIDRKSDQYNSDRDSQYSSDSSNEKKNNSIAFESRSIADSSDSFFNQYNEDGSFIGEYCLDDKRLMAPAVSLDTLGSLA